MTEDRERGGAPASSESTAITAALRHLWRMIIAVVGVTVVLIGIAMLVLPGPAIIVIPAGLAILATEFAWARRLLHKIKEKAGLQKAPKSGGDQKVEPTTDRRT